MKIIPKKIYGKEAREKMMAGVDKLANVVGSTMGGKGRNVVVDKEYGSPLVINDGVSIANEIFLEDDLENLGAQMVKDAANRTNATAGDGTSATTVLARAILKEGWAKIEAGENPVLLRKQLEVARDKVEEKLKKLSYKVETEQQAVEIATVSVQDKEVGQKIGELMFKLGANGAVAIKNSIERGVFVEKVAGLRLEGQLYRGVIDNKQKWETKFDKPAILILKDSPEDHELESKWVPFVQKLAKGKILPNGESVFEEIYVPNLLIIAEKLSDRFISGMARNMRVIKWSWFRPTTANKNMKEIYEDLKSVVGGDIVEDEAGVYIQNIEVSQLGKAETAKVNRHELVVTSDMNSELLLDRINDVKGQMENAEDEVEKEQIRERLANLTGGVATIKVAAATEQDTTELKLRIEDAVNATRSAMDEGYVSGGGIALLNCCDKAENPAEEIMYEALKAPCIQILENAGYENVEKLLEKFKKGEGINVLTDETVDMIEAGIIDPLKVIRMALINAVSVSGLLLTSEYVIVDKKEDDVQILRNIFTKKE